MDNGVLEVHFENHTHSKVRRWEHQDMGLVMKKNESWNPEMLEENSVSLAVIYKLYLRRRWTFQEDNVSKNTAQITQDQFLKKVMVLAWLSQAAGLNSIESLWRILKLLVQRRIPLNPVKAEDVLPRGMDQNKPQWCKGNYFFPQTRQSCNCQQWFCYKAAM